MPINNIERLRRHAMRDQETAHSVSKWLEPLVGLKTRPRSYKLDDQAYQARSYAIARNSFEEYERATLHMATP